MSFFKRIFFWVMINAAVIAVIMTIVSVFGLETRYLTPNGLNLEALAVMSILWGFTGSFISLLISKWMAKKMMGVQVIESPQNHQESKLIEVIGRISQQAGIKMPEVGIYESNEINAFATGARKNASLVAVSSGLLNEMNDQEVEGVLAHEIAHIANGDMVTMALLQGVINAFVIFFARIAAFAVQKALGKDNEEIGGMAYWLTSIVFEILFSILASVIIFAFSRYREYRADLGGAQFTGKQNMIAALKKLQASSEKIDTHQKSFATMKISDQPSRFSQIFSTHPPLAERIMRLQQSPIH